MRIGIDVDNVLSNFNDELLKEFLKHDKELRNSGIVNSETYITRGMFDWSKEEQDDFYNNNIERIVTNLDVIDKAPEYIKKLKELGYEIYIVTGRDNGEYSDPYKMTADWLQEHNIQYDKLLLTNAYNSPEKAKICIDNNISIMIDDSIKISQEVDKAGIKTLLMDTPYNRQFNELPRVHNWKEIYEFIINYKKEKLNVILDTDTYNECDDQFALAYMLKSQDIFNIEAITVAPFSHIEKNVSVKDGQELSYNEILKICKWLDFDTKNKVFKGSQDYICNGYNEDNDAVNKIIEISLKNDKTYIMAIGAITNVALAIKKEPKIIDKIEVIWLGGNELGYKDNQEFNFRQDIDAVKVVFNSKVKLTILPCKDVISKLRIDINTLKESIGNKSELCDYLIDRFYNDGYHGLQEERVIWDISVIAYMINKSWFKIKEINCPNINENTSYELNINNHEVTFVNNINTEKVYEDLFRKLGDNSGK